MHVHAGWQGQGVPALCGVGFGSGCGWSGGKGEGLRRKGGRGQRAANSKQHGSLMTASDRSYCAPLLAYIRKHCMYRTASAPERPQVDAATGHDLPCVYSTVCIYLCFLSCLSILSAYLYVAYGSPALQPFSIETPERDTNTLTHLAHSHPVRVYIPLSPYRPP